MQETSYAYKAFDRTGAEVSGQIVAADAQAAYATLTQRGLRPFQVTARHEGIKLMRLRGQRATRRDLARYIRQLATLLSANVTVLDALGTLSQSSAHGALAQRTSAVKRELRAGRNLSGALETHFADLPPYVIRLAELGEATGSLAKAISDAADRMDYEDALSAEIRSALAYPTFLALAGGAIVFLMFLFVVPRFSGMLGDGIENAPWISRQVIGLGVWVKAHTLLSILIVASPIAGVVAAARQPRLAAQMRTALEDAPLVGAFLKRADIGDWARTVGVALQNKASLIDALRLGETGARSLRLRRNLETVRRDVRAGRPLEEAMQSSMEGVDPLIIDLVRTGRNAGALDEMMLFAADLFEKDAKNYAKRLTALAEPVAILFVATIVGTIVIAIVLAMTSLYQIDV